MKYKNNNRKKEKYHFKVNLCTKRKKQKQNKDQHLNPFYYKSVYKTAL